MKTNEAVQQLPQYKCHKVVRAGRIQTCIAGVLGVQVGQSKAVIEIDVGRGWVDRHQPQNEGYLVVYEDGYLSYSPADVFEAGYHELPPLGTASGGTEDAAPSHTGFQWRKKPVVIEAFQWTGGPDQAGEPQWIVDAIKEGNVGIDTDGLNIVTLEGVLTASPGDWIIRGIKGELYPCKPDIFAATYEPVSDAVDHTEIFAEDIDLNAADFSDALMWLKEGKRVQRAGWNGSNQWAKLVRNSGLVFRSEHDNTAFSVADGLVLKNAQGIIVQWVPSIGDLLATDWQVVA